MQGLPDPIVFLLKNLHADHRKLAENLKIKTTSDRQVQGPSGNIRQWIRLKKGIFNI